MPRPPSGEQEVKESFDNQSRYVSLFEHDDEGIGYYSVRGLGVVVLRDGGWRGRRQVPGQDKSQDEQSLKRITRCRNLSLLAVILSVFYPVVEFPLSPAVRFLLSATLVLAGTGIRFQAIAALGAWFTSEVATQTGQKIVKHGLYKYLRHPAYTGSLVFFLGIGLSTNSLWGLAAVMALMSYALLRRISVEEKVLAASFGQEYTDYLKTTKKLIPFVF